MQPLCVCHCSYEKNLFTLSERMRDNFQLTNLFLYALIIHNHHIQQEWKQFHFTDTQVVCIKGGRH